MSEGNARVRVLVVGEGWSSLDDVLRSLAEAGFEPVAAAEELDALEALALDRSIRAAVAWAPHGPPGLASRHIGDVKRAIGRPVPVVALSHVLDGESRAALLAGGADDGADDCITWPGDPRELAARLRAALRRRSVLDAVRQERARLVRLSSIDEVTGLSSWRAAVRRLRGEMNLSSRGQRPCTVLLISADGLPAVAEPRVRAARANAVRAIAQVLERILRASDTAARREDDAFLCIAPESGRREAVGFARRVHAEVQVALATASAGTLALVGAIALPHHEAQNVGQVIHRLERALERARTAGADPVSVVGLEP